MVSSTEVLLFVTLFLLFAMNTYSYTCDATCSNCRHGLCTECYYGFWGPACQNSCKNCWIGGCDKRTGRCHQCPPGHFTEDCSTRCPHVCRRSYDGKRHCERDTGVCLEGCIKGKWGPKCNRECGRGCSKGYCLQEDGGCLSTCTEHWHGRNCDSYDNCRKGIILKGACAHGCQSGWTGKLCTERCLKNCVKCDQYNHTCTSCEKDLYGPQCALECSSNCLHDCDMTGRCERGCIEGFYGKSCKKACPFNCLNCEQETGVCNKCKIGFTGETCVEDNRITQLHAADISSYKQSINKDSPINGASKEVISTHRALIYWGIVIPHLLLLLNNSG